MSEPKFTSYDNSEYHRCPYCEKDFGDTWDLFDYGDDAECECEECGESFEVIREVSVNYVSRPIRRADED